MPNLLRSRLLATPLLYGGGIVQPSDSGDPGPDPDYHPASMVFNGTNEALVRTLSTSGASTTIFTYSLWVKVSTIGSDGDAPLFQIINDPSNTQAMFCDLVDFDENGSLESLFLGQDAGTADWGEIANVSPAIGTNTWRHIVIRYDSTLGTADDRLRFYLNGSLLTDSNSGPGAPGASEQHILFANGFQHQIAAVLDIDLFLAGKLAFIEVLDGVSADASAFAFSNGGVWTRKPYTGSYGTHGFFLDGSTGVLGQDVSGNGQHFTGLNMDNSNLDTADLPPYTS